MISKTPGKCYARASDPGAENSGFTISCRERDIVPVTDRSMEEGISVADTVAHAFLEPGKVTAIVPLIILGIIFHRRENYEIAACFLCFAMVFNWILKYFFKIPLLPHLGQGYAFPSGHMHAAAVFYGYILYKIKNPLMKIPVAFLIAGIGFALVHSNYHDWFDVLGAVAFAAAEIGAYHFLKTRISRKIGTIFALAVMGIMLCIIYYFYKAEPHIWLAFYAFVGFLGGMNFSKQITLDCPGQKVLALFLSLLFIALIYRITAAFASKNQAYCLSQLKFLFFPAALYVSLITADKCECLRRSRCAFREFG
jgi:undecaprenyl-diphosphatase